jgi:hypothetical protein
MPRVPYTPYPELPPERERFAPQVGVHAGADIFGGGVAQGIEKLGGELEQAGNQFFTQAVATQHLNNESKAKDIDTSAMMDIAEEERRYRELPPEEADKGFQDHLERLDGIRKRAHDQADSPEMRNHVKVVDNRVASAMIRSGDHRGDQARVVADRSSEARMKTAFDTMDVSDPADMDLKISTGRSEAKNYARRKLPGVNADEYADEKVSKAIAKSLIHAAPVNPEEVDEQYKQHESQMSEIDRDDARKVIDRELAYKDARTKGTKIVDSYDPSKGPGQKEDILEKVEKQADKYPDNPAYRQKLRETAVNSMKIKDYGYRDTIQKNRNMVESFAMGRNGGQKIVSMDGIIGPNAPPGMRDAFYSLPPSMQRSISNYVNKEEDHRYSSEQQQSYWQLRGLARTDPKKFLDTNMLDQDLPRGKIDDLKNRQERILNHQDVIDNKLSTYEGWVSQKVAAAGVHPSKTDPEVAKQYDKFKGGLEDMIQNWEGAHPGRAPDYKTVQTMAQQLLQQIVTKPGWFTSQGFGRSTQMRFEIEIPDDDRGQLRDQFRQQMGRDPTEQELTEKYMAAKKMVPAY